MLYDCSFSYYPGGNKKSEKRVLTTDSASLIVKIPSGYGAPSTSPTARTGRAPRQHDTFRASPTRRVGSIAYGEPGNSASPAATFFLP